MSRENNKRETIREWRVSEANVSQVYILANPSEFTLEPGQWCTIDTGIDLAIEKEASDSVIVFQMRVPGMVKGRADVCIVDPYAYTTLDLYYDNRMYVDVVNISKETKKIEKGAFVAVAKVVKAKSDYLMLYDRNPTAYFDY